MSRDVSLTKWFLLVVAPFFAGILTFVSLLSIETAILWGIILFVLILGARAYTLNHQGEAVDVWEVSEEQWNHTLEGYVREVKTRNAENKDS